jgi:hypothetical protein
LFSTHFVLPHGAHVSSNITSIEKRGGGGGCVVGAERRRRHRDEAVEGEEGDATPDLSLKTSR